MADGYDDLISGAEARYDLPPGLLAGVINRGERSGPDATSPKGAHGVAQFMPDTAAQYGVNTSDPASSIDGAGRYLADNLKRFGGSVPLAVAAYNAGPGAVEHHGGVPPYPETTSYVQRVVGGLSGADIFASPGSGGASANAPAGDGADIFAGGPTRPENVEESDGQVRVADAPVAVSQAYRALKINKDAPLGSKDNPFTNWQALGRPSPGGAWVVDETGLHLTPGAPGDPGAPKDAADDVARNVTAFGKQTANAISGGYFDKALATAEALPAVVDGGLSKLARAYSAALDREKVRDASDARDAPFASMLGGALGFAAQGGLIPEWKAAGLVPRLGIGALKGGVIGAVNASGDTRGDLATVASAAGQGGLIGAAIGAPTEGLLGPRPIGRKAAALADYQTAQVDPMLATSGGPVVQQVAQQLKGVPGLNTPLVQGAQRTADQLNAGVLREASSMGAAGDRVATGRAVMSGAQDAKDALQSETGAVYAPVNAMAANPTRVPAPNTVQAINDMFAAYPNMPGWLEQQAPKLRQVRDALSQADGAVTFGELKGLRTDIGGLASDFTGAPVDKARLTKLYGALSDDMMEGAERIAGSKGMADLTAANRQNTAAQDTISAVLDPVLQAGQGERTAESAFDHVKMLAGSRRGADIEQLNRLKASIPAESWGDLSSGIAATMGRDPNGGFSAAAFATDMKNMTPQAKRVLFGENAPAMQALANVAGDQQAAARFYNHSQSGNLVASTAAGGAIVHAAVSAAQDQWAPAAVVAGLGIMGRGASELLSSPGFARMVMKSHAASPAALDVRLGQFADRNPQAKGLVDALRRALANLPTTTSQGAARAVRPLAMQGQTPSM